MHYLSLEITDEEVLKDLRTKKLTYYTDFVEMKCHKLQGGTLNDIVNTVVPAGTKLCFVVFHHECQSAFGAAKHSNPNVSRLTYPPRLSLMRFQLPDCDHVVDVDDFRDCGTTTAPNSKTLRRYYIEMLRCGIYTDDFETFIGDPYELKQRPGTGGLTTPTHGYNQVYIMDMSFRKFTESTPMTINLEYQLGVENDDKWCRPNYMLKLFYITQRKVVYDPLEKKWEIETMI